jgi:spermidine/putrescine transport system ATP-binding protein
LGPSGCGKTTLLRLIAGFEAPSAGDIFINGQKVNHLPPNQRAVNTVFQSYALFPHMSVGQNVAFGLEQKRLPRDQIRRQVAQVMDMVKLTGMENRLPARLSGGQQQRVALARALVNHPLVLLLDEPLSALDFKLRKQMRTELKQLQRRLGITFVFVTHDQEEAFSVSDRIAVMEQGIIRQLDKPEKIYEEPTNLFVAGFVGDINILSATIVREGPNGLIGRIGAVPCPLTASRTFTPGQTVKILLRPEDLRISRPGQADAAGTFLTGTISACTYKGATVDITIQTADGLELLATEFFDEDAEKIDYRPGESVKVGWVKGWEVVLGDE